MPLTITAVRDPLYSDTQMGLYTILCDNSYTASGYVLDASSFGRKQLSALIPIQQGTANRIVTWDGGGGQPGKLRLWTALGTEATGASDQSSITVMALVIGPRS